MSHPARSPYSHHDGAESVAVTHPGSSWPTRTRPTLAERSPLMQRLLTRADFLNRRAGALWMDDAGMSTVEYAIGTIGAAAFGAVLIAVVKSDSVQHALLDIIQQALTIR